MVNRTERIRQEWQEFAEWKGINLPKYIHIFKNTESDYNDYDKAFDALFERAWDDDFPCSYIETINNEDGVIENWHQRVLDAVRDAREGA